MNYFFYYYGSISVVSFNNTGDYANVKTCLTNKDIHDELTMKKNVVSHII